MTTTSEWHALRLILLAKILKGVQKLSERETVA